MAHTLVPRPVQLVLLSRREGRTPELYMGFKIACQSADRTLCFEVFGALSDHLDSLAKYVKGKAARRNSVLIDIRGVTKRRLLRTRGYQICSFSDEETARDWLL